MFSPFFGGFHWVLQFPPQSIDICCNQGVCGLTNPSTHPTVHPTKGSIGILSLSQRTWGTSRDELVCRISSWICPNPGQQIQHWHPLIKSLQDLCSVNQLQTQLQYFQFGNLFFCSEMRWCFRFVTALVLHKYYKCSHEPFYFTHGVSWSCLFFFFQNRSTESIFKSGGLFWEPRPL